MRSVLASAVVLSLALVGFSCLPVFAQANDQSPDASQSLSAEAFSQVAQKMHQNMMITYSGNTDQDFVRGMIPHHEGAVDMAQVELKYGSDPELRKLARQIIKDQNAEIAMMQNWLAHHGG